MTANDDDTVRDPIDEARELCEKLHRCTIPANACQSEFVMLPIQLVDQVVALLADSVAIADAMDAGELAFPRPPSGQEGKP